VPAGTEHVLGKLLAQQQMEFYGGKENGVQPGQVVLDCGAHIGVYVREALSRGASKVVAIEPAPSNVECLRRNFEKEIAEGRVIVAPVGVWDQDDVLPLYEFDHNSAADSFIIKGKVGKVLHKAPLTTIDKLAQEHGLSKVDYIKMDIKGAVLKALKGASATIARDHPRIAISTEEEADDPRPIRDHLAGLAKPYSASCGVCTFWHRRFVHPDVMFFQ
jgi:FkbM family methyltransferase